MYTGAVEAPHRVPYATAATPVKKHFEAGSNRAYAYTFVHVPKAGGTYFLSLLRQVELARIEKAGGPNPRQSDGLVRQWSTAPLVDLTEMAYANTMWHYVQRFPAPQFGGGGMAKSFAAGYRAVSKGSLSMVGRRRLTL